MFSLPQALERFLSGIKRSSVSDLLPSGMSYMAGRISSRAPSPGGVLDQVVWPALPQGDGEIPVTTHHAQTGILLSPSYLAPENPWISDLLSRRIWLLRKVQALLPMCLELQSSPFPSLFPCSYWPTDHKFITTCNCISIWLSQFILSRLLLENRIVLY